MQKSLSQMFERVLKTSLLRIPLWSGAYSIKNLEFDAVKTIIFSRLNKKSWRFTRNWNWAYISTCTFLHHKCNANVRKNGPDLPKRLLFSSQFGSATHWLYFLLLRYQQSMLSLYKIQSTNFLWKPNVLFISEESSQLISFIYETKYSRMDQIKFKEDSL